MSNLSVKRLKLLATTKPWNIVRAIEELGDSIYPHDSEVAVVESRRYKTLIYIYSVIDARRLFRLVVSEPPAYVERIVPVEKIIPGGLGEAVEYVVSVIGKHSSNSLNVEVKPRGIFIKGDEKHVAASVAKLLAMQGIRVRRHADKVVKIEDTEYGIVVAFMDNGSDRLKYWRRRRLGVLI